MSKILEKSTPKTTLLMFKLISRKSAVKGADKDLIAAQGLVEAQAEILSKAKGTPGNISRP